MSAGDGIKANADSMLYHTTDSPYFDRVASAVWFDSESSAEAAGFTRWDRRDRNAGGTEPVGYDIKGNADSMLYHTPDSAFYGVTKAEVWFRTEQDARNAGFRSFND